PTALTAVEEPGSLQSQEVRCFDSRIRLRDWELDSLIGADRSSEHHPVGRVARSPLDEPAAVAERLRSHQDALGVPAVDDVPKAFPLLANEVCGRYFEIVDEEL